VILPVKGEKRPPPRRSWLSLERDSPRLVTVMAGRPRTGHFVSQIPQPMQSSRSTWGFFTATSLPLCVRATASSSQIAFFGVGQTSWQTMQGIPWE